MNASSLIATAVLAATAFGTAYSADLDADQSAAPGKTRTEVIRELDQARAAGELSRHLDFTFFPQQGQGVLSRAEVAAQLRLAREQGVLAVGDAAYPVVQATAGVRRRDEVKDEAIKAAGARAVKRDYDIGG